MSDKSHSDHKELFERWERAAHIAMQAERELLEARLRELDGGPPPSKELIANAEDTRTAATDLLVVMKLRAVEPGRR